MKKRLYAFESGFKRLSKYEELGFNIELDDPANGDYYVSMDVSDYDMLNLLQILHQLRDNKLFAIVEIDNGDYNTDDDFETIENMVNANPLMI